MSIGFDARVSLSLVERSDLDWGWAARASGSKSLMFQVADASFSTGFVWLGAMLITSDGLPLSWGDVDRSADLMFWDDRLRPYVQAGAEFGVWYSEVIGHGVVRECSC